jgi:hypothetical protein
MKKLILSLVAIATISLSSFGQVPEGFKYQAVVRDAGNLILNNQAVGMQLTIQQGSIGGTAVYSETFIPTSNAYGLVNIEIGSGNTTDDFSTIDWSAGPYFIETAMDVTGGTTYVVMGTSQLMSVPYALYAKTSGNGQGPVGPAGATGAVGATGATGITGADGIDGIDGAVGPQGIQGLPGLDGADGIDGAVGPQGIQGLPGLDGADGIDGAVGPTGATGITGADGIDGIDGAVGPTGATGITGADGIDGIDGAVGPQGIQGLPGLDGADGIDGAVGPTGATGITGADGIDGIDGAVGPTGATGITGADGIDGIDGAVGPTGATGITGADGIDGIDGAVGPQGIQGLPGLDGADGIDGAVGPTGATGITGADGVDGIDGAVGPQGIQGLIGLDGADGIDGAVGPTGPAGSYTAGTGIDITAGVISVTSSTGPEYLMVSPDAIVAGYVSFGSASAVNGVSYNSVTDEFTLKAGKTYMLDGAVYMHTTTSGVTYSFVFYDKTNNTNLGTAAYQRTADYSGTMINQPAMSAIVTPVTDIQVGIKDMYGATGGFASYRGFFRVVELK